MLKVTFIVLTTLMAGWMLQPADEESTLHAYPEQLPGTYTGGFGEEACHSCHFDYPLNPEEGSINIQGIPSSYEPGKTYTLTVEVSREDLGKAGFQLAARYADSTQAGSFGGESDRIEFTNSRSDIQYMQHSGKGTEPNGSNTSAWSIKWTAPEQSNDDVVFNLAANAANGDDSEFGDYIFTREIESSPQSTN